MLLCGAVCLRADWAQPRVRYEHFEKPDDSSGFKAEHHAFNGQVLEFPPYFDDTHNQKEDVPAVQQLYSLIYTLKFWLDWDSDHVAVLTCSSGGRLRTGFVVACYLTYCGLQPDTIDAFRFFLKQRSSNAGARPCISLAPLVLFFFPLHSDSRVRMCLPPSFCVCRWSCLRTRVWRSSPPRGDDDAAVVACCPHQHEHDAAA